VEGKAISFPNTKLSVTAPAAPLGDLDAGHVVGSDRARDGQGSGHQPRARVIGLDQGPCALLEA
jgi:hypothetical protein